MKNYFACLILGLVILCQSKAGETAKSSTKITVVNEVANKTAPESDQ
jgi:hypothetical protein